MAQHDGVIDDQDGLSFLSDLNSFIAAIISNNSGASAPSTTYAHQFWADTSAGKLKKRNSSNTAWVVYGDLDVDGLGITLSSTPTFTTVNVDDDAYDEATWDTNLEVPTKNAIRDKFENISETIAGYNSILQIAYEEESGVIAGSTIMPRDDTIPQITEGFEVLSITITPVSSTSLLEVTVEANASPNSGSADVSGALFKDGASDAVAACSMTIGNTAWIGPLTLSYRVVSGTTSPITFTFRIGKSTSGTLTFNGASSGRYFGGVCASSIQVKEYTI
jgi:hypothetical protein